MASIGANEDAPWGLSNTVAIINTWWRHPMETFSALLAIVRGIHRSPVNSPHRGQWRGALMFSLICAWMNGWVNNREAGDLRRQHAQYDVTVIIICSYVYSYFDVFSSSKGTNKMPCIERFIDPPMYHKSQRFHNNSMRNSTHQWNLFGRDIYHYGNDTWG